MNLKKFEYETINGERTIEDVLKFNDNKSGIILNTTIRGHENESIMCRFKTNGEHLTIIPCSTNFYKLEFNVDNMQDVIIIRLTFNCKCIIKKNTQIFKVEM